MIHGLTNISMDILNIWEKSVSFQGYPGTLSCSITGVVCPEQLGRQTSSAVLKPKLNYFGVEEQIMDLSSDLLLKRAINIKVIVTERWKEEVQKQLQTQINRFDSQLQQLDAQGQQAVTQLQQSGQAENVVQQQVANVQNQVNTKKNEILQKKNQAIQQLDQVQKLEMGQEVGQGQLESFFTVKQGDNLVQKMQVEILLEDGIIKEVRGAL